VEGGEAQAVDVDGLERRPDLSGQRDPSTRPEGASPIIAPSVAVFAACASRLWRWVP